jgi:uncharacterized membrane protein
MYRTRIALGTSFVAAQFLTLPAVGQWNLFRPLAPAFLVGGVSPDGTVVVGSVEGRGAAYWTATGGVQLIGVPQSHALAASENGGAIIGYYWGYSPTGHLTSFLWTKSTNSHRIFEMPGGPAVEVVATDIASDGSRIVGTFDQPGTRRAFRWTPQGGYEILPLPAGAVSTDARATNDDGSVIVGAAELNDGRRLAIRWTVDGVETLGDWPGKFRHTQSLDVSGDGGVVVGHSWAEYDFRGFRWTDEHGFVDLGPVPGSDGGVVATSISRDGVLVVGQPLFIWSAAAGMRTVAQMLAEDYGFVLTDYELMSATIAGDGQTIVGNAVHLVDGTKLGYRIRLPIRKLQVAGQPARD